MKQIGKLKPQELVGVALAILIVVVAAVILLVTHKKSQAPQTASADAAPTQLITKLKADPKYQHPHTDVPYDELFRNSDKHKGEYVKYTGKVIQVLGEPGKWELRVNITKKTYGDFSDWQDTVYVYSYSKDRVIENDVIEFTALANGTVTYKSAIGSEITLPSLIIYENKLVGRAE